MRALFLLCPLALAACGPLVQIGSKEAPPPALLRLSPTADTPHSPSPSPNPSALQQKGVLRIVQPAVPAELRTLRIPVERTATQVQFLAYGQWVEPPAPQLQRLLLSALAARTGRLTVDERSADVATQERLSGRLTAFGLDVSQGKPQAHLRFEALLTRTAAPPRSRIFEIYLPVAQQSAPATAAALQQASHMLADQLALWLQGADADDGEQGARENH